MSLTEWFWEKAAHIERVESIGFNLCETGEQANLLMVEEIRMDVVSVQMEGKWG